MRARLILALGVLAVGVSGAGPASAKDMTPEQKEEMSCVHRALVMRRKTTVVAQSFLNATTADGVRGQADNAINGAADGCARAYGWDEAVRGLALTIGMMGATTDHLGGELKKEGVTDEVLAKVSELVPGLSKRDSELLSDGAWDTDRSFMARIKSKLVQAGVPDSESLIHTAVMILECAVIAKESADAFVAERFS